jgi:hypothetical protein
VIVKVQLPLGGSEKRALIYDEKASFGYVFVDVDDELRRKMGDAYKKFFEASLVYENGEPVVLLGGESEWQEW